MDNYEFLNSSPETQFELMNTMLQLEQLARSPTVQPSFNQQMQSFTYQNQYFGTSQTAMREMIYHIAAMQPVNIDLETAKPPKRRNVKISKEPQSVAARLRREKISERIRILQRLVPGGSKMDTASMLDEAINYVKFLKSQVQNFERVRDVQSQMEGASMLGFGSDASVYPCYANQDEQFMPY